MAGFHRQPWQIPLPDVSLHRETGAAPGSGDAPPDQPRIDDLAPSQETLVMAPLSPVSTADAASDVPPASPITPQVCAEDSEAAADAASASQPTAPEYVVRAVGVALPSMTRLARFEEWLVIAEPTQEACEAGNMWLEDLVSARWLRYPQPTTYPARLLRPKRYVGPATWARMLQLGDGVAPAGDDVGDGCSAWDPEASTGSHPRFLSWLTVKKMLEEREEREREEREDMEDREKRKRRSPAPSPVFWMYRHAPDLYNEEMQERKRRRRRSRSRAPSP